jgi:hypothetical protein
MRFPSRHGNLIKWQQKNTQNQDSFCAQEVVKYIVVSFLAFIAMVMLVYNMMKGEVLLCTC